MSAYGAAQPVCTGQARITGANARARGAGVTNTPTVGAIAVWRASPRYGVYGHVGIVIEVAAPSCTVAEMNYRGEAIVDQRVVVWPDPDTERVHSVSDDTGERGGLRAPPVVVGHDHEIGDRAFVQAIRPRMEALGERLIAVLGGLVLVVRGG